VGVSGRQHDMSSFEFERTIHPRGYAHQRGFACYNDRTTPWVRFVYEHDGLRLLKEVAMRRGHDEGARALPARRAPRRADLAGTAPLHAVGATTTRSPAPFAGSYPVRRLGDFVALDAYADGPRLWMSAQRLDDDRPCELRRAPRLVVGFHYREEAARGVESHEDIFVPGWFRTEGRDRLEVMFRAVAGFGQGMQELPEALEPIELAPRPASISVEERLDNAADAFVVSRSRDNNTALTTILAGYPWFGDWGRDTFVSLPGLLLETGRYAEARQVLEVFASSEKDGLVPNRFSDYGDGRDYNSVDASLWFIHAADAYCRYSGDEAAWAEILGSVCARIVEAYARGTRFNIHADPDGLIACGDCNTQLTWMDTKCNNVVFTPRHGKPVEVNALWHHALCVMARRTGTADPPPPPVTPRCRPGPRVVFPPCSGTKRASTCTTWSATAGATWPSAPTRSSPSACPIHRWTCRGRRRVVQIVQRGAAAPYGLRSLSPQHPTFPPQYEGPPFERDAACHQGTVWAWPDRARTWRRTSASNDFADEAKAQARQLLGPLVAHLDRRGARLGERGVRRAGSPQSPTSASPRPGAWPNSFAPGD